VHCPSIRPQLAGTTNLTFPVLNAARAFAAFWVLVAHVTLIAARPVFFVSQGALAVDCFILLSGFLMMLILLPDQHVDARNAWNFYVRRFFRIAPSFYFAVALYLIFRGFYVDNLQAAARLFGSGPAIPGLDPQVGWKSVVWQGLFLHGLWPDEATKVFGPGWSLSLEMQFYLIAPFWAAFIKRWSFPALAMFFVINLIANKLWGVFFHPGLLATYWFPSFLPNRIFLFCSGGVCCLFILQPRASRAILLAVAWLGAAILLPWKSALVCSGLIAVIISASLSRDRLSRLISTVAQSRFVCWLAELSYGIYLYHVFCMAIAARLMSPFNQLGRGAQFWLYLAGVVAISVGISSLIHVTFERPARELGRRLTKRARRPIVLDGKTIAMAHLPRGAIEG
jgi:peptidoglycan/LPS O-acetylase OafA/YrhL